MTWNNLQTLLFAFSLTILSCKQRDKNPTAINSAWVQFSLPHGWTFYAPKNFSSKPERGIDSDPGGISSSIDSIYLDYDSGTKFLKDDNCDFQKSVIKAQNDITNGFYKDFYKVPLLHKARVDTIDGKVAIIVTPTKTGNGSVDISISDCKSGAWLGISGTNLSVDQEKLVLAIFKTIKLHSGHS